MNCARSSRRPSRDGCRRGGASTAPWSLAQIDFLLHQHEVQRHQQNSLDSYVDEPLRGVDWQIQGMKPTGAATAGTELQWQHVIARTRAVPAYLATARAQLAAGVRPAMRRTGACWLISA